MLAKVSEWKEMYGWRSVCVRARARASVWWMDKCMDECMDECVGGLLTLAYNRVKSKSS